MTPPPLLELSDLRVRLGDQFVVSDLNLRIETGEMVALVGPSGCGKTTVLRSIAGLQALDEGSCRYRGRILNGDGVLVPPEDRQIGLVFQEGAVFPHLDVRGNLAFGLWDQDESAQNRRLEELCQLLQLGDLLARAPHRLSGGQLQRVALGRALAPEPALVLLDEPFASLDSVLRQELRTELFATLRSIGTAGLLVTHDRDEAALADRVYVLRDGRMVQEGSPEDLRRQPRDLFVASFFGGSSLVAGERTGNFLRCADWAFPVREGGEDGPATVVLLPDELEVAAPGSGDLQGTVRSVALRGGVGVVEVSPEGGSVPSLWALASPGPLPSPGDPVGVRFRQPPFHCIQERRM